jgi:uncharacterized Zn finger protein (UPF0148 family)
MHLNLDDDVNRPPDSSSDSDTENRPLPSDSRLPAAKTRRKSPPPKPTRSSKRRKLDDKPDLPPPVSTLPPKSGLSQGSELDVLLSQSQSRLNKRGGYSNRNKSKYTSASSKVDLGDDIGTRDFSTVRRSQQLGGDDFGPAEQLHTKKPVTKMGAILTDDLGLASSVSSIPSKLALFDATPELENRKILSVDLASPPVSALNSATSPEIEELIESAILIEEETTTVCPVCGKSVDSLLLSKIDQAPQRLSLKKQQDFCHRHRVTEATPVWKKRGYPNIDWEVLEIERIPKHTAHLRDVLRVKRKSFFLSQLESALGKFKGNRKMIRNYLTYDVKDGTGYYGPKGASIMVKHIQSALSKELSDMCKDKLVQAAGIGGFVVAVLVPELSLKLVMEDMGIKQETKGRKFLEESSELGRLLHPDDDHIELEDLA